MLFTAEVLNLSFDTIGMCLFFSYFTIGLLTHFYMAINFSSGS